jgi:general secretion pathway protein D
MTETNRGRTTGRRARGQWWSAAVMIAILAATGCSGYSAYRKAQQAEARGDWDDAVLRYSELAHQHPSDLSYRSALLRAKIRASQAHFETGKKYAAANILERALIEYQQAVALDPSNQYAATELEKVRADLDAQRARREKTPSLAQLKSETRGLRPQPPVLEPRAKDPIDLSFPKPTPVTEIYKALGKAFGINVLFDPNLKDQQITLELKQVTAQTALEFVMRTAGHFYKVVDEHSILVAADTPQNRRTYEDLVIQTFYLSNAEVKEAITLLRSLIGAKNLAPNEQLNSITIKDTADKVKVAEQILYTIDKSRAEVVVDVELLQINTTKLRDIGLSLSENSVGFSIDVGGDDVPVRLSDLQYLNQSNWILSLPSFLYNFVKNSSDAQVLAKPQLRISEGEKANLTIGDKVPIPVTTFNTATAQNGGIVPITSFQYQDVGIKIEMEPRVHHNKEVSLKLKVEVSDVGEFVEGSQGSRQPIISTRNIDSVIRLKDGETNILAGLITTDESNSEAGIPGLSDVPVLGRLFSNHRTETRRTDVVLTMTPHIVRLPDITKEDLMPIWVGTEANTTFRGGSPRVESEVIGPFDEELGAGEEGELEEQLQNLPPGLTPAQQLEEALRQQYGQAPPAEQPSTGIDLVPPAFPGSAKPPPPELDEEPPPDER